MRRSKALLLALLLCLSRVASTAAESPASWTVLVYMVGGDLENGPWAKGLATADVLEMLSVPGIDLWLCTGGAEEWQTGSPIASNQCTIWQVREGELQERLSLGQVSMGDPNTLSAFVGHVQQQRPGSLYGLILWDHGAGPLGGFGRDQKNQDDSLTLGELCQALENVQPLACVGVDACLMASSEVAFALRDRVEYLVASEEKEDSLGWNYATALPAFKSGHTAEQAAAALVEAYRQTHQDAAAGVFTLSAVRCAAMTEVSYATEALFQCALCSLTLGGYPLLSRLWSGLYSVGGINQPRYDLVDHYALGQSLLPYYPEEAQALLDALKQAIVSSFSSVNGLNGLSLYLPMENQAQYQKERSSYSSICDAYNLFLDRYTSFWGASPSVLDTLPAVQVGTQNLEWPLSPQQANLVNSASVLLFHRLDGAYYLLSSENGINLDDEGRLRYAFADKSLWFVGEEKSVLLPLLNIDRQSTTPKGFYSAMLSYADETDVRISAVRLEIALQEDAAAILRVYPLEHTLESGKREADLSRFLEISCIETGYMPAWNESGDLMPFSQWEQTETVLMDGWVQLNRPYTLAWRPYPADWELYALLCFRDVYGNEHVSHLIPVER